MPGGSSWRSPSTADQYRHHDYADFAQEFLQRNADYRQDHADTMAQIAAYPDIQTPEMEGLARRWGLSFPTLPTADPRKSPALWSPEEAPDVVVIESPDPMLPASLPPGCEPIAEATIDAGHHIVLASGPARLRLCVRHAPRAAAPSYSIACDASCALRLAAASRLERATRGGRLLLDRAGLPTSYQRLRFVQFLAIYDALEAGASVRDLAFGLVFPNHRPLASAIWKGSGERRHVLRLIAKARRLVGGGYRQLLRHG